MLIVSQLKGFNQENQLIINFQNVNFVLENHKNHFCLSLLTPFLRQQAYLVSGIEIF